MKALKRLASVIFVAVVAVIVATLKKILAFGVVATVFSLLHMVTGTDTAKARAQTHRPARTVAKSTVPSGNGALKVVGPNAPAPSSGPSMMPSAPLGAGPINAARNAAAAQNAQLAKETGQQVPTPGAARPGAPPANPAVASAPAMQQGAPKSMEAPTAAMPNAAARRAADTSTDVMRETFDYTRDSRRDPFVSLMTTSDLRPTLSDLRLTGILYDLSGRRPVAILRDIAGGQWRVTTGMTLGRMRVAQIKPKTIIFTIEEFGFNRQDSLVLGDTTRVRHR